MIGESDPNTVKKGVITDKNGDEIYTIERATPHDKNILFKCYEYESMVVPTKTIECRGDIIGLSDDVGDVTVYGSTCEYVDLCGRHRIVNLKANNIRPKSNLMDKKEYKIKELEQP